MVHSLPLKTPNPQAGATGRSPLLWHDDRGQPREALERFERALAVFRGIGAPQYVAAQLANIAFLLHETPSLSRQAEAIPLLEEGIALMEEKRLSHDASGASIDDLRRLLARWRGGA